MKNRCVLVTGASGGIGFGISKRLIELGANVGLHYASNKKNVEELLALAHPKQCRLFQGDFKNRREVSKVFEEFLSWHGKFDVLINNAGIVSNPAVITDVTECAWDETMNVNVTAPFFLSQAAFRVMAKQKYGRIINVSSIGVKYAGGKTTAHYSASKAALEAITRSFAKAGAPHNILVNALRVGVSNTKMHEKVGRSDLNDRVKMIPMKRMVEPQEVAEAVIFLASEKNSYMTGAVIPLSGGE